MALRSKPTSPEAFIEGLNSFTDSDSDLQQQVRKLQLELAQQSQREQQLVTQIKELQSQPLALKEQQQLQGEIDKLREHLKQTQGVVRYPVEKIRPNPEQPRKTFDEEVEAMVLSLQAEGQLAPVILFEDGTIFDGECRWRSSQVLQWENLDAVIIARPKDEKTLLRKAYLSGRHRRNLNALDQAETLVTLACDYIPELPPQDVPRIISRVLKRLKRKQVKLGSQLHLQSVEEQQEAFEHLKVEGVEISEVEIEVFLIFLGLQEHPVSLDRNIFTTLKLSVDLKDAVRHQRLACPQALALNRLSAEKLHMTEKRALKLRQQGIEIVVAQNLSEEATKKWVIEQKKRFVKDDPISHNQDKKVDRIIANFRALDFEQVTFSLEQRQELEQLLNKKLQQLKVLAN